MNRFMYKGLGAGNTPADAAYRDFLAWDSGKFNPFTDKGEEDRLMEQIKSGQRPGVAADLDELKAMMGLSPEARAEYQKMIAEKTVEDIYAGSPYSQAVYDSYSRSFLPNPNEAGISGGEKFWRETMNTIYREFPSVEFNAGMQDMREGNWRGGLKMANAIGKGIFVAEIGTAAYNKVSSAFTSLRSSFARSATVVARPGTFASMMEPAEAAKYQQYWQGLTKRAPIQAQPYEIIPRYTSQGAIKSYTTYDKLGFRAYQYEVAPGVRHGSGYHVYDQTPPLGASGKGSRGSHIPFND